MRGKCRGWALSPQSLWTGNRFEVLGSRWCRPRLAEGEPQVQVCCNRLRKPCSWMADLGPPHSCRHTAQCSTASRLDGCFHTLESASEA